MIPLQNSKFTNMLAPISINGTAATCSSMDTLGGHHATIILSLGVIGAADFDAVNIIESDDDSSYSAAITGTAMAVTQTDDGFLGVWSIPLRGTRKRYLKPTIDPGAVACLVSVVGILHFLTNSPQTAAAAGLAYWVKLAG